MNKRALIIAGSLTLLFSVTLLASAQLGWLPNNEKQTPPYSETEPTKDLSLAKDHHWHLTQEITNERGFIEHMIPHHQEAVDTARAVLERGGSIPEIVTLANTIIETQEREIAMMKSWYESWYGTPYVDTGVYVPMMRDLSALSGAELDRVFLEDMIPHHIAAVKKSENLKPYIVHPEMSLLIESVIASQSAEINLMRELLTSLPQSQ